jgi:hypothetical protein
LACRGTITHRQHFADLVSNLFFVAFYSAAKVGSKASCAPLQPALLAVLFQLKPVWQFGDDSDFAD